MEPNKREYKGAWKKDLRLYIHVPFCVRKCLYCDFLSGPSDEQSIEAYFNALYKEIKSYRDRTGDYIVSSVFIGGGTPSCVNAGYISRTLFEIGQIFELSSASYPEITIEVNPGTLGTDTLSGADKLIEYKRAGINRLSFGLQSSHDRELRLLGRIHSYSEFIENYRQARELGFNNINVDLMSALPGQTKESFEETLHRIAGLGPEHISAYSLIIEEGTPFYNIYGPKGRKRDMLPSEEADRQLYKMTKEILLSYGYRRYEISNYAKEGFECRHNMAYWEGVSYLGLGLGSASLINNRRFNNIGSLEDYLRILGDNHKYIMSTNKDNTNVISKSIDTITDINIDTAYDMDTKKVSGIDIYKNTNKETNKNTNKDTGKAANISTNKDTNKGTDKDTYKDKDNHGLLYDYNGIRENIITLSRKEQMEEFMFLGLRKSEGVSKSDFSIRFGLAMDDVYSKQLSKLSGEGLICIEEDRVRLTDYGIDVSNRVMAEFLFD